MFVTKLEVSTAFLFREIGGTGWTDGQTDGLGATFNAVPKGGPDNNERSEGSSDKYLTAAVRMAPIWHSFC